jgi:hypothetical protein
VLAPIAGGSPEADALGSEPAPGPGDPGAAPARASVIPLPEVTLVAVIFAGASVFFGIFPSPLFNLMAHAGHALSGLF